MEPCDRKKIVAYAIGALHYVRIALCIRVNRPCAPMPKQCTDIKTSLTAHHSQVNHFFRDLSKILNNFLFNEPIDPNNGHTYSAIWKYYSTTDTWMPVKAGIHTGGVDCVGTFAASGIIYMTNGFNLWYSIDVLQKNPELKQIAFLDFSGTYKDTSSGVASVINNQGYVFFSFGEFWQYSP